MLTPPTAQAGPDVGHRCRTMDSQGYSISRDGDSTTSLTILIMKKPCPGPLPRQFHLFSLGPPLPATYHRALGTALQPLCTPPHWPLTQPMLSQLVQEHGMADRGKGFTQVHLNNSHCSPHVQHPVAPIWTLVKHDFPLVNPHRLHPITFWSFLGMAVFYGTMSSNTLIGNEGSLNSLSFPRSSLFMVFKIRGV